MKMNKFRIGLLTTLLILGQTVTSQKDWLWSLTSNGTLNETIMAIDCDDNGNIYVTGTFRDTLDFSGHKIISSGWSDVLTASFDPEGKLRWVKNGGGQFDDSGLDLCVDDHFVYVTGSFHMTASFGNKTITSTGPADGAGDMFLLKYDLDGNLLWITSDGSVTDDTGNTIACDNDGNTYVGGTINYTATFGEHQVEHFGFTDLFLAKYNKDGLCEWAKSAGGSYADAAHCIEVVGNKLIVSGSFNDVAKFDTATVQSVEFNDVFIACYELDGSFVEIMSAGGMSNDYVKCMAVDDKLNVYLGGSYLLDMTIGTKKHRSKGGLDMFILKYQIGNGLLWSQSIGGSEHDEAEEMHWGLNKTLLMGGTFEGTVDFGNTTLRSEGYDDGFLMTMEPTGTISDLFQIGGVGSLNTRGCIVDINGNYYLTGSFVDEIVLGEESYTPIGGYDFFLAKIGITTSMQENLTEKSLAIFPNPTSEFVTIRIFPMTSGFTNVELFDLLGHRIKVQPTLKSDTGNSETTIDLGSYPSGAYLIKIKTKHKTLTTKIIKL